jgi:vesicular inhibitory amino acid transporter
MFPLALGLLELIAPYLKTDSMVDTASSLLKLVLTILALVVSLYFPSFSFLVAFVGMFCTMAISIVFPAAAHLRLFGPRLGIVDKCIDWSFIICGLTLSIVGTYATFT